ncbi:hypothetical protein [Pedobacter nototheniae]|uniref:hypothetical protein n=1 Tax=Pedobacter nototheniae TaxID=2488994 RepID=UPI00103CA203|nr:hypothetical protein [Pedobacter nototheniae]
MARIRTIKPDFFKHEDLSELSPMVRLLFIGLWTQADREGKLEDRPKRLKIEIFPYDDFDINEGLNALQNAGFILRYSVENANSESTMLAQCKNSASTFIKILSFVKHQQPNTKEARSTIPNPVFTQAPYKHSADTVLASQEGERERNGIREREQEGEGNTESTPSRDHELEDSILNFFGFTVQQNFDKARTVNEFCFALKNSGTLNYFRTQFDAYKDFKELSGGFAHGFYKFLGDQKKCFEDGAWNAENWTFRLNEEKEKSSAKKEKFTNGQQTDRGINAAMKVGEIKMMED